MQNLCGGGIRGVGVEGRINLTLDLTLYLVRTDHTAIKGKPRLARTLDVEKTIGNSTVYNLSKPGKGDGVEGATYSYVDIPNEKQLLDCLVKGVLSSFWAPDTLTLADSLRRSVPGGIL
jgi:hypothetical protein